MKAQEKQLYYLSELSDYEVDSNFTDVQGWPVKDAALRTIGKVSNLLVNKQTERVVYLDVEVDDSIIDAKHDPYRKTPDQDTREYINEDGENHIIIPIGLVDINNDNKYVFAEIIDHKTFAETKRVRPNTAIQRAYEDDVLNSYRRSYVQESSGDRSNQRMGDTNGFQEDERPISELPDDKFDWYDASYERLKDSSDSDRARDENDFYHGKPFDDSKFNRK